MPIQSTIQGLTITRPEIYFASSTNTDVYVKTARKSSITRKVTSKTSPSYEGNGGIPLVHSSAAR